MSAHLHTSPPRSRRAARPAGTHYSGYRLVDREHVLAQLAAAGYPPLFHNVVADHVTYAYPDRDRAPSVRRVELIAHARGDGVEAFLVRVDGHTRRPSGGLFHLTYSLALGHTAKESKSLVQSLGETAARRLGTATLTTPLRQPIRLDVAPF